MSGDPLDPRIGDIISTTTKQGDTRGEGIVVLGFPHDEGVRRNGGRVGASKGPSAFRTYVRRLCASDASTGADLCEIGLADGGDIEAEGGGLEGAHAALEEKAHDALSLGRSVFCVGGGNDQSHPNALALVRLALALDTAPAPVLVINIDAHLDVRPLKEGGLRHSGSPFRLMLEDDRFARVDGRFVEFAAQGPQCALDHVRFLERHNARIHWLHDLYNDTTPAAVFQSVLNSVPQNALIFVSFDLDAVRSSDAPGVSCASPEGLSAHEALQLCRIAGADRRVRMFDLSEYNPVIDEYRTGRLVAMMFHAFACNRALALKKQ